MAPRKISKTAAARLRSAAKTNSEIYIARRGAQAPQATRAAALAASGYTIEVRFVGGLSTAQKAAFRSAADRWTRVIVGDLPDVEVDGETINNLLILAEGAPIDGEGNILGQAGPTRLRPANAGAAGREPLARVVMAWRSGPTSAPPSPSTACPASAGW